MTDRSKPELSGVVCDLNFSTKDRSFYCWARDWALMSLKLPNTPLNSVILISVHYNYISFIAITALSVTVELVFAVIKDQKNICRKGVMYCWKPRCFVLYRPVFRGYSLFLSMVGSAYLKQDMTQRAGVSKSCGGVCVCVCVCVWRGLREGRARQGDSHSAICMSAFCMSL